jgi:hypothetical protein
LVSRTILMGAINAGMLLVASRAAGNGRLPVASPWVLGIAVLYIVASLLFVLAAIDGLRHGLSSARVSCTGKGRCCTTGRSTRQLGARLGWTD